MKIFDAEPRMEGGVEESLPPETVAAIRKETAEKQAVIDELFGGAKEIHEAIMAENEALEEAAIRDPLTGAYNRRGTEKLLGDLLAKAYRKEIHEESEPEGAPERNEGDDRREPKYKNYSVMVLDIDHFKLFNDKHGHGIGDVVLNALVTELKRRLRATDVVGRWGGEEFVIIFPGSTPDEILKSRFGMTNENFAQFNFQLTVDGKRMDISASGGIVEYRYRDPKETLETAVARADAALYRAKHEGRNRILSGEEGSEDGVEAVA